MQRPLVELLEIRGGIAHLAIPLKTQPTDIVLNSINKDLALFLGVRVIKTQIANAAKLLRQAKIDRDRLGMTNMQKAVRLGRKTRYDRGHNPIVQVILNLGLEKITSRFGTHGRS